MGTTSGTTHIKTMFSFSQGTGQHFIGNDLCISDDSVTQRIHVLQLFTINDVFYKPTKRKYFRESSLENGEATCWMVHHSTSPFAFLHFWTGIFLTIG
jgi:hypothetical protein